MSLLSFVKRTYLTHFSKPAGRRLPYRLALQAPPQNLVLLGLGELEMVERLITIGQQDGDSQVSLTGVDLFEMRGPEALSLKDAHRRLAASGAKVRLVPGDPWSALARTANSLTGTDLLVIAADVDAESLARAWFYVPRMLHPASLVLRQTGLGEAEAYEQVPRSEIDDLAEAASPRRRAA